MWDLPRLGLEPVSPALAGRFSTTAPPGKPRSCGFYLFFFCCGVSHCLIFICWTILMTLGWILLGCGVWSFLCVVGFGLLIFCWEFLHLYSSKTLACNFPFWCYLCLVLVSGWWWLHRMTLGVFPLLLEEFEKGGISSSWFGRIPQWSQLVLDFFCREFFKLQVLFHF